MLLRAAWLVTTLLLAALTAARADAPSLLDFDLRSLSEPETHSLKRYAGKPVLMLFFQPDCTWCLRQVKTINELGRQCDAFSAMAIGVLGTRSELRTELRRLRPAFPAYQASPRLLESLGEVETTPLMLFGDADGRFVTWWRGYAPEDKLVEFMGSAGTAICTD